MCCVPQHWMSDPLAALRACVGPLSLSASVAGKTLTSAPLSTRNQHLVTSSLTLTVEVFGDPAMGELLPEPEGAVSEVMTTDTLARDVFGAIAHGGVQRLASLPNRL